MSRLEIWVLFLLLAAILGALDLIHRDLRQATQGQSSDRAGFPGSQR